MKKITLAAIAIAGFSVMSTAFAGTSAIKAANNQAGIQIISTYVDYTETGNGILGSPTGTLDTETGSVPGYAVSISGMKDLWLGNDYFEAAYSHASGNTEYTGAICMPTCGAFGTYAGTSAATLTNFSARYGAGMVVADQSMLTPYLEFGRHEWDRGINAGEVYTNGYFGVGVRGQYSSISDLVLTADVMFGKTFSSYITVNAMPGIAGGNGFSGALGNSSLLRIGAGADFLFAQNLHATIGVEYTGFNYGISAVYPVGGGYLAWEPDSKSNLTTVSFGLGYGF